MSEERTSLIRLHEHALAVQLDATKRMTVGTRYAGFPVTLVNIYSWRQRTE